MRRSLALILILPVLAVAFAGCSDGRKIPTPAACQSTPAKWLAGLTSAPEQVMIEESTLISECFPADQSAAQQEEVGRTTVEVATALSDGIGAKAGSKQAADVPTGATAAIQAGYLVGAVEKAAESSAGIHATLVERVEAAATNGLDAEDQEIQGAYQRGYEAGLESG